MHCVERDELSRESGDDVESRTRFLSFRRVPAIGKPTKVPSTHAGLPKPIVLFACAVGGYLDMLRRCDEFPAPG